MDKLIDKLTAESIVAVGLTAAFILCICMGTDKEITMSLGAGLVGFIGHAAVSAKKEE